MVDFKCRDEVSALLEKNPLLTCTPVMAGRKLNDQPPESPFLTSNKLGANLMNTPVMHKVTIDNTSQRKQVQIGGIIINRPNIMTAAD